MYIVTLHPSSFILREYIMVLPFPFLVDFFFLLAIVVDNLGLWFPCKNIRIEERDANFPQIERVAVFHSIIRARILLPLIQELAAFKSINLKIQFYIQKQTCFVFCKLLIR